MPPDQHSRGYEHHITTTDAERLALAAAKVATTDALNELLATFGVARGSVDSVEAFRKDLMFLRSMRSRKDIWPDLDFLQAMRNGSVKAAARMGLTILTLLTGAFAYGMVAWLKTVFAGK